MTARCFLIFGFVLLCVHVHAETAIERAVRLIKSNTKQIEELKKTKDMGVASYKVNNWNTIVLAPPRGNFLARRIANKAESYTKQWGADNDLIIHVEFGRHRYSHLRCGPGMRYTGAHRIWLTAPTEQELFEALPTYLRHVYDVPAPRAEREAQ